MIAYTLKALATKLETNPSYLRRIISKTPEGKIPFWRGFKFIQVGGLTWLAIPEDEELEIVD